MGLPGVMKVDADIIGDTWQSTGAVPDVAGLSRSSARPHSLQNSTFWIGLTNNKFPNSFDLWGVIGVSHK